MPPFVTVRHLLRAASALLAVTALLAGCGKQDLYEPPGSPYRIVGSLALPSANEGVAVLGRTAYVAAGEAGLHTVDWSDPAAPALLATLNTYKYADSVTALQTFYGGVLRDIVHVVEGTEGVTSYDVTDPSAPVDFNTGTTAVNGRTLFIEQPLDASSPYVVYMAEDWKGVRIFESVTGDPGTLAYNGVFVGTNGKAYGIEVRDGWGYVADDEMGLCVLDLTVIDLDQVALVSWADTPGNARAVALENDHAFVADGVEGLAVFRIDADRAPVKVAQYDLSGFSEAIDVRDGLCVIAANTGGVHVLDVSEPAAPVYLGSTATSYATGVVLADDGHCLVVDEDDGLLVLGGRGAFRDTTPPSPVSDLAALPAGTEAIDLTWTATGDDRMLGAAARHEIRRADAAILDDEAWAAATPVTDLPPVETAGTAQTATVTGLEPGATYHFAARIYDDADLASPLSTGAAATTSTGIVLRNAGLTIAGGLVTETFTYEVEAIWPGGFTTTDVIIDGEPHAMTALGDDLYRYETVLAEGVHTYAFRFTAVGAPDAETPTADGPAVGRFLFTMGSPAAEPGRGDDEPLHLAIFTEDIEAAPHEVTQAEWDAVMPAGTNPSQHPGADRPVDSVTWNQAVAYCNARSVADGAVPAYTVTGDRVTWNRDADGWRLPTEAEWEYLCRAGTETALSSGDLVELNCRLDPNLDAIGWYCGNAPAGPEVVEQKAPNAGGLYDMSGNVREWCWDWYGPIAAAPSLDAAGPDTGVRRVCRGGSWYYGSQDCRSAARGSFYPDSVDDTVGFRVVRTVFID